MPKPRPLATIILTPRVSVRAAGRVVAEALNSVFDVFAEPAVNDVVVALDLVSRLATFLPALKTRLRDQRRFLPRDLFGRLDEAKLNLARFIKYKRLQF